jgi:hypothetical protein
MKSKEDEFLSNEKKDPTEDHITPFEDRMVAGSLEYPSGY